MPWCASRCWSPTDLQGGPGFRCWRRSASSPRNNSSPAAKHPRFGPPTRGTSPDAKPTSWPCGTAPASEQAHDWFTIELANLRTAFRWAADHGDLDVAATIATYAGWLGVVVQTFEPIAWAEELIEPARAVDHPRLAFLYVIASLCYTTGRIEAAVGYTDAGQIVLGRSRDALPYGIEAWLGAVYLAIGQPERLAELCRAQLARRRDTHVYIRAWLVAALAVAGSGGEAMDSADGLIEAAEATGNPHLLALALGAYGVAFRDADPVGALNALGRGLVIAQDSGNRANASALAAFLARLEAEHGDTVSAFDHLTLAIRNYHNAGDTTTIRVPLASPRRSFRPARTLRTGGHHRRLRAQSHGRSGGPRNHHRDHPPPRRPRRGDLRIARPQGRDDDHRRHGDLRIRPNRPGPNRTRTPWLSCASRVSNAIAQHVLNRLHSLRRIRAESQGSQISPVASKTQLVSAVARSSNQVGGACAVMLPISQ